MPKCIRTQVSGVYSWHPQRPHDAWCAGAVSFAEFDACVQGWINHVRHADTLGLRAHVLGRFELGGRDISKK
jgi:RNA-directed DNA polymerase